MPIRFCWALRSGAGQEDGLLINHNMRAGLLLIAVVLAVVQTQCSAFVFKASSTMIPRRSHKLCSQLNPQALRTTEEMRDSQFATDELVYNVALDMAENVKEQKISEKLLPHLVSPLGTPLLDGLDFCLPVLEQVEYITSFFANYDSVTLALLEVVLRVKFELHGAGQRLTLSPLRFSNAQLAEDKKVVGNILSFRSYTFDLTQLHTFLLICVDLFRAVDAKLTGKSDILQALRVKYEPEVTNWETYHGVFTNNFANRLSGAVVGTELPPP